MTKVLFAFYVRDGQTFFVKGLIIPLLGFAGHMVSFETIQICYVVRK